MAGLVPAIHVYRPFCL